MVSALHHPWEVRYPMAHACVTARVSMLIRVSQATSFEIGFSRPVPRSNGMLVLRPNPRVEG